MLKLEPEELKTIEDCVGDDNSKLKESLEERQDNKEDSADDEPAFELIDSLKEQADQGEEKLQVEEAVETKNDETTEESTQLDEGADQE